MVKIKVGDYLVIIILGPFNPPEIHSYPTKEEAQSFYVKHRRKGGFGKVIIMSRIHRARYLKMPKNTKELGAAL